MSGSTYKKVLDGEGINPHLRVAKYAVRGELPTLAAKFAEDIKTNPNAHPFPEIIQCNLGNPMALGNPPYTYLRQLIALCEYPVLMDPSSPAASMFPEDVQQHAREILADAAPGGMGAYTGSQGLLLIRKHIAQFIENRDKGIGEKVNPENIWLLNGSSNGIQFILTALLANDKCGVMVPVPQYPIYSALLSLLNGQLVPYYLNEQTGWSLDIDELVSSIRTAREQGIQPKAIVVLNPGNPTGQILSEDNIANVIKFAYEENLLIMADEVYQENIYADGVEFHSFRKVMFSMDPKYHEIEMVSYHSSSKGLVGECGKRGGYMEIHGFSPDGIAEITKECSMFLCPNLTGQVATDFVVNPPKPGSPSYELFSKERNERFQSLKRRATVLSQALAKLEGVNCNLSEGSMYVFPQITFPPKAIEAAAQQGRPVDSLYAKSLLETTGVCVVPGSGFGQKEGTMHIRSTILPLEEKIPAMVELFTKHHNDFFAKYA